MEGIFITIYLATLPAFALLRLAAWLRAGKTRLSTLFSRPEDGEKIWQAVFDWRVVLWFYLLAQYVETHG